MADTFLLGIEKGCERRLAFKLSHDNISTGRELKVEYISFLGGLKQLKCILSPWRSLEV